MRKIILLLGIVLLCGCEEHETYTYVSPEGSIPFAHVTHFEYRNHQYIKFETAGINSAIGGVVHDPDCKYCNIKEHEK